jgi:hypothetical protein
MLGDADMKHELQLLSIIRYVFGIGKIALEDTAKNIFENDEAKKSFLGPWYIQNIYA